MSKRVMLAVIIGLLVTIAAGVGYIVDTKAKEKQQQQDASHIQNSIMNQINKEAIEQTEKAR